MNDQALTTTQEPETLLSAIIRAASDPAVDMEKMDRLLQMQERMEARADEGAFNEAMTAAQTEMGRVKTNKDNSQTKSRYADYASLDQALRPIYTKHGFALSFTTGEAAPETVRVVCLVSRGRYTRQYHIDMPADGKGAKGGDVMTKTHATGAATTYGRRYLLTMIFNLAIGEDTDGNMPGTMLTESQVEEIKALLDNAAFEVDGANADYGAWLAAFLAYMKVGALSELSAKDYEKAKQAVVSAKKARAKK